MLLETLTDQIQSVVFILLCRLNDKWIYNIQKLLHVLPEPESGVWPIYTSDDFVFLHTYNFSCEFCANGPCFFIFFS